MIKDDVIYMPVLLAAYYGLRRSEAVGLSWSNIDFENGIIHVSQKVIELTENGKTELIISKDMKNESSRRSLPLISDVKKILLEQKERQETYRKMFRGDYNRKYLDMVCVDPMGNLIASVFRYCLNGSAWKRSASTTCAIPAHPCSSPTTQA